MGVPRIDPRDVYERMCRGERIHFVDVRAEAAWAQAEHKLPAAIRIPPDQIDALASDLSRGEPLVAYCSSDGEAESTQVAHRLHQLGHEEVYALAGGFDAWRRGGYPVEQASAVSPVLLAPT